MPNQRQREVVLTNVVSIKSNFDNVQTSDSGVSLYGDSESNGSSKLQRLKAEPVYYVADPGAEKQSIAVIGSGNFGRALAMKISQSGYHVNIGSRNPEKTRHLLIDSGVTTTTIHEAVINATSRIIILLFQKIFMRLWFHQSTIYWTGKLSLMSAIEIPCIKKW